jgi:hypothetical protein
LDKFAKGLASGTLFDPDSDEAKALLEDIGITREQFNVLSRSIEGSEEEIRSYGDSLLLIE